jgi:putative nucleotidyltransferase with HDIG domain
VSGPDAGGGGRTASAAPPLEFLRALANVFSTAGLYGLSHPVAQRAFGAAGEALGTLLRPGPAAVFSFLGEEVVFGERPLRELKDWPWSARLAEVGIQRLEFLPDLRPEELEGFVAEAMNRLDLVDEPLEPSPHPHIRYGTLGFRVPKPVGLPARATADPVALDEESDTVRRIHEVTEETGAVPAAEAAAVVRALAVAMHETKHLVAPLVDIGGSGQYSTSHCLTVSVLAMSLAEYLNLSDAEVRAVGEAALLHDIGKTRLPPAPDRPGGLTEEERKRVERHPVEGARILLGGDERHALAAVVAYEHHLHWSGTGGYPERSSSRKPHRFSRLVQVCDVYDALRTERPFRPPLTAAAALEFLSGRAGTEFDPELVAPFVEMMREWEPASELTAAARADSDGAAPAESEDISSVSAERFDADLERPAAAGGA